MKDKIENTQNQDLIDLGAASIETKGEPGGTEGVGIDGGMEISAE